jgi:hypothetical protein
MPVNQLLLNLSINKPVSFSTYYICRQVKSRKKRRDRYITLFSPEPVFHPDLKQGVADNFIGRLFKIYAAGKDKLLFVQKIQFTKQLSL